MTHTVDRLDSLLASRLARRRLLGLAAAGGGLLATATANPAGAAPARLLLNGGPRLRPLSSAYPGKGEMIVQRARPPLLETPFEVFNEGVFTPNDRFYVRWHWGDIPAAVDTEAFRLGISGAVRQPLSLSLAELLKLPRMALAAVNQCAGNSRGLFEPRLGGAQWSHGAMGNALWEGVSLKSLLARAGVKAGALAVRFGGLDQPLTDADPYAKSLPLEMALTDDVMVAFAMNGEQLPLLNGFPLRLVVPGWYSTYWIKALNQIEVLDSEDRNFWTAKAYKIPTAPFAHVAPGTADFPSRPISTMVPRSFLTNVRDGASLPWQPALALSGIAFGGAAGVKAVELSSDGGRSWQPAALGPDEGRYGFRRFTHSVATPAQGALTLLCRCTASDGAVQAMVPNWNPSGYQRGCVEPVRLVLA